MSFMLDLGAVVPKGSVGRRQTSKPINRYCRSVDRIDEALSQSIFHVDATADYGDFCRGSGHGAINTVCESLRACVVHSHQITTVTVAFDGDQAGSEAYHIAAVRLMADDVLMQVTIWRRYLDRRSRRDGRWGIDHREVLRDFDQIRPVAVLAPGSTAKRGDSCRSHALIDLLSSGAMDSL